MKYEDLLGRAKNAFRIADFETAEKYTAACLEQHPERSGLHVLLGNIMIRREKPEEAVKAYEKALEIGGETPEALNNLGIARRLTGRLKEAVRCLERAAAAAPERADIRYNLGNFYKLSGDLKRAAACYTRCLELDPGFILAYNNLGTIHESRGDHSRAEELYRAGLRQDPNQPTLHYNLGVAFEAEGKTGEACAEFELAITGRPRWVEGLNNLGVSLHKLGKDEEAEHAFRTVLSFEPGNPQVNNNIGVVLSRAGRFEEAEGFLREALEADPGYTHALMNLGELHHEKGENELAETELRSLIGKHLEDPELRLKLGVVLTSTGKFAEAMKEIGFAVKHDGGNPKAHAAMGDLLMKMNRAALAVAHYRNALKIAPGDDEVRMHLAEAYRESGEFENAVAELSTILRDRPDAFDPRFLLGEFYYARGLYGEALSIFNELRTGSPDHADLLHAVIRTYNAMGEREKALEAAEELFNIQHNRGASGDIEGIHSTLDLYEQVVERYSEDFSEIWERNLGALESIADGSFTGDAAQEEESLLFEDIPDLEGEAVPIIDVGGMEPVLAVYEDEETLNLNEEESPEPEPEPEDNEAPIRETPLFFGSMFQIGPSSYPAAYPSAQGRTAGIGSPSQIDVGGPVTRAIPPIQPRIDIHQEYRSPPADTMGVNGNIVIRANGPIKLVAEGRETPGNQAKGEEYAHPGMGGESAEVGEDPEEKRTDTGEEEISEEERYRLLEYLEDLTRYLPEARRRAFENSEMESKVEAVRLKLKEAAGIHDNDTDEHGLPAPGGDILRTRPSTPNPYPYDGDFGGNMPNDEVRLALNGKISHILKSTRS